MLDWQPVTGGRARTVQFSDGASAWVRVADEGTVHFFTDAPSPAALDEASPSFGWADGVARLTALDAIDIVCRSLGGDDPGPMYDAD